MHILSWGWLGSNVFSSSKYLTLIIIITKKPIMYVNAQLVKCKLCCTMYKIAADNLVGGFKLHGIQSPALTCQYEEEFAGVNE